MYQLSKLLAKVTTSKRFAHLFDHELRRGVSSTASGIRVVKGAFRDRAIRRVPSVRHSDRRGDKKFDGMINCSADIDQPAHACDLPFI